MDMTVRQVRPGPRAGFRWDRETIIYAIELWHRRYLRTPTKNEWMNAGTDHPCHQTVRRVFGTWNAGIRAAGFAPRPRGRQKTQWSRRRCLHTGRFIAEWTQLELPINS